MKKRKELEKERHEFLLRKGDRRAWNKEFRAIALDQYAGLGSN